jgi:hypothetical protein
MRVFDKGIEQLAKYIARRWNIVFYEADRPGKAVETPPCSALAASGIGSLFPFFA